MSILFPTAPASGKNSKVFMNKDDGNKLNAAEMTVKATLKYRGELYENRIYTLGAGKTLINMRPAVQPRVDINAVLVGCEITPSESNDKVNVSAGILEIAGAQVPVTATEVSLTRPTGSNKAWVAIKVSGAGVLAAEKGTDGANLNDTYGAAAGNRPYIGEVDLLLGFVRLDGNTPAKVADADIDYVDRETPVEVRILPNIGGALLDAALAKCHTGGVARKVKFTGYYLDKSLTLINSGKGFTLTPKTSEVSEETFDNSYGETTVSGYSFSFEQLATDKKAIDAAYERGGHCAVRFMWPNGYYQQTVGTLAPTMTNNPTAYSSISVAGQCGDFPVQSSDM